MRRFQLTVNLYYLDEENHQNVLDIYTDGNNIWETICSGISELLTELQTTGTMQLPSFGARDSHWRWP